MNSDRIGQHFEEDGFNSPNEVIDSNNLKIGDVLTAKGQKLTYLHDFGAHWQPSVTLAMTIDDLSIPFPICCTEELNYTSDAVYSLRVIHHKQKFK